jgi:pimeloyl-ACP methyl ester carboxylesterase
MLETSFETINGKRLRVARAGIGPTVVLLHGYPDNLQIWCRLVPLLSERFDVIAFDWPGLGRSEEWSGGATPFHKAERLLSLLDHWKIERAAVVGLDMGGQPALVAAALHPERVSKLVVMNSLVFWNVKTSWEIAVLRRFRWNEFIIRRLPRVVFRRAEKTFLPEGERLPSELREDLWSSFSQTGVRRFIVRMCAGYQGTLHRLPDLYAQIQCPTLALWAECDKHFPVAHARRLNETIPRSRLHIIRKAEHWMALHAAQETAEAIIDFYG